MEGLCREDALFLLALKCHVFLKRDVQFFFVWFDLIHFCLRSLHQTTGEAGQGEVLRSTLDLEHSLACDGQFEEEYQPLKAVGKGAFGFVWKAIRRCDGQEV